MTNEHTELFKEETRELLEELESSLLELEKNSEDEGLVKKVFRALHTIKGSGAMFGFDRVSEFTHQVENLVDMVRSGKIKITRELIGIGLSSIDVIKNMIDSNVESEEEKAKREAIIKSIKTFTPDSAEPLPEKPSSPSSILIPPVDKGVEITYRIRFKPQRHIQDCGIDIMTLMNELHQLGSCKVIAHMPQVPTLDSIEPSECYVFWDVILTTSGGKNPIKDVFIFAEDQAEIQLDIIDDSTVREAEQDYKKLGDILVERGDLSIADMKAILSEKKLFGEMLVDKGIVPPEKIESALVEQEHIREIRKKRQQEEMVSTLRVPAEKADKLVNLVGELVTMQARLSQAALNSGNPELESIAEEAERLIWDLRDSTMSIRMLPISTIFSRFTRLVRDLSGELHKDVELITEGGETELDKTVIERLTDPLLHVIRNCIDHGLETPLQRIEAGKDRKGIIRLSASYSGARVVISIQDDGAGIDLDEVRAKAIEKGIIKPGAILSEQETLNIIFEPGFSTAKTVTNISGRGVGMDIIKKNIETLRGTVSITSTRGQGARVTLQIPLTLAIIDGLLVDIDSENFIIPLSVVEEIVELTREDRQKTHGRHIANIRGRIVPYIDLRDYFEIGGENPPIQQIVVVDVESKRLGLVVDQVVGKHQTVIKSLGRVYRDVDGLSGATILGDGTVALIIDVSSLTQVAERIEIESVSNGG